jgi:hypothetical protein
VDRDKIVHRKQTLNDDDDVGGSRAERPDTPGSSSLLCSHV